MLSYVRLFCDAHEDYVGSPHPPACTACDILSAEYNALPPAIRDTYSSLPDDMRPEGID